MTATRRPITGCTLAPGGGALSVHRPFAGLIVAGHKTVENRSWWTRYRGRLFIHAARAWDVAGAVAALTLTDCDGDWLTPDGADWSLTAFGFVGTVDLVDIHAADGSCCPPWGAQPDPNMRRVYHWELTNPVRFPQPVPGRGYLGVFRVPAAVVGAAA